MKTKVKNDLLQTVVVAALFAVAAMTPVYAQDVIGVQPVSQAVIAAFKIIALAAIAWGFFRLMNGRHTVEAMVALGIGGLGLAKTQAIAGLFGL